jgi:hypothetical protein
VCKVDNRAGKKARLHQPQQKPHRVKPGWRCRPGGQRGDDAPGNHDAADPLTGAPFFDSQRPGDFQQKISQEENSRAGADDVVIERRQIPGHRQLGQRDIDAVDVGDDVTAQQNRQQAQVCLFAGAIQSGFADGLCGQGIPSALPTFKYRFGSPAF